MSNDDTFAQILKHKKRQNTISFVFLVIAVFFFIVVSLMVFIPVKTIEFYDETLPILNDDKTIKRGEDLFVGMDYCRYKDYPNDIRKYLINGMIIELNTVTAKIPLGCHDKVVAEYISRGTPPGTYYLEYEVTSHVNILRRQSYRVRTELFNITY